MATANSPTNTGPIDLAKEEDDSTVPFPDFDPTILSNPDDGPNVSLQPNLSSRSPPFDPFASGKGYAEFPPNCKNITRGFPVYNDNLSPGPMRARCFPPPNLAAYEKAMRDRFVTPGNEEETDTAMAARLRVETLRIVVPQDGYFREVEVDSKENWRSGLGLIGEKGDPLGMSPRGYYGEGLRERVGEDSDESGGSEESEEDEVGWKLEDEIAAEIEEARQRDEELEEAMEMADLGGLEEAREMEDTELPGEGGEAEEDAESEESEGFEDQDYYMNAHPDELSKGEEMAQRINFERDAWVTTAPGVSGDILPAEEQREDFIDDINSNGEQLGLCTVCGDHHIPPGPPITLADRDTCGSLLPKWFPSHRVERPWDTYRALINELVALEEKTQEQQALSQDPAKPRWDLEWHEGNAEWTAAGRREGWWKCRSGPDAPEVERNCQVCHRKKGPGEQALTVGEEDEMREERKRVLQGFIDRQVQLFGEMDKEIALARIQLESMGMMKSAGAEAEAEEALASDIAAAKSKERAETAGRDLEEILGSKVPDEAEEESSGSDSEEDSEAEEEQSPESKGKVFYF